MAVFLEKLSLSKYFPGFTGVLFDIDGSLLDNEGCQEKLWKLGVVQCFRLTAQGGEITVQIENHISHCFESGEWADFVPGIFNRLVAAGKVPKHMTMHQFDEMVTAVRAELMLMAAEKGEIFLLPGVKNALSIFREKGFNRGLYTNSPEPLSRPVCEYLLGEDFFNLHIPPSGRVYGWEVTGFLKPHPLGWDLAQQRIGTEKRKTLIVEDRPQNILGAVRAGFGGAIGICDGHQEKFLDEIGRNDDGIYLIQDWRSLAA